MVKVIHTSAKGEFGVLYVRGMDTFNSQRQGTFSRALALEQLENIMVV